MYILLCGLPYEFDYGTNFLYRVRHLGRKKRAIPLTAGGRRRAWRRRGEVTRFGVLVWKRRNRV